MTLVYDFAPLEAKLRPDIPPNEGVVQTKAAYLGIPPSRFRRYRRSGLSTEQADRLAIHVGLHPSQVWDSWWADSLSDVCPSCPGLLPLTRRGPGLCSACHKRVMDWERCRNRKLQRRFWVRVERYRDTVDPEGFGLPIGTASRVESLVKVSGPGDAQTSPARGQHLVRGANVADSSNPVHVSAVS